MRKTSMPTLSILGCGFLGQEMLRVAQKKTKKDSQEWTIMASHTGKRAGAEENIRALGATPVELTLDQECLPLSNEDLRVTYAGTKDFFTSDAFVIALPPRRKILNAERRYPIEMLLIRRIYDLFAESSHTETRRQIIFISSTSVYGMHPCHVETEDFPTVNEASLPLPETASGRAIYMVEQAILTEQRRRGDLHLTVLRLGGLIGPGRHPRTFSQRAHNSNNGNNGNNSNNGNNGNNPNPAELADLALPTNLIHVTDAAQIIWKFLNCHASEEEEAPAGEIYNVVTSHHPTWADIFEIALPNKKALLTEDVRGKIVSNKKLLQKVSPYKWAHADIAKWCAETSLG